MRRMLGVAACLSIVVLTACSEEPERETVISFGVVIELLATAAPKQSDVDAVIESATVMAVVCGSSAADEGVQKGDSIRAIDGARLIGMTVSEYGKMIKPRKAGIRTVFAFKGTDGEYSVTLETRAVSPDFSCGNPSPGQKV